MRRVAMMVTDGFYYGLCGSDGTEWFRRLRKQGTTNLHKNGLKTRELAVVYDGLCGTDRIKGFKSIRRVIQNNHRGRLSHPCVF